MVMDDLFAREYALKQYQAVDFLALCDPPPRAQVATRAGTSWRRFVVQPTPLASRSRWPSIHSACRRFPQRLRLVGQQVRMLSRLAASCCS